jgi:hypothetical protein
MWLIKNLCITQISKLHAPAALSHHKAPCANWTGFRANPRMCANSVPEKNVTDGNRTQTPGFSDLGHGHNTDWTILYILYVLDLIHGAVMEREHMHSKSMNFTNTTHKPYMHRPSRLTLRKYPDIIHSFIHLVVCLTTGPKPLPKRALHIVRFRASSFKWEYPLLSLRSSNSFLRLLPC